MPNRGSQVAWTLVVLGIAGCGNKSAGDGRLRTLAASKQVISYLAVDGADLYWNSADATSNDYTTTLMTMPVAGGTPRVIASGHGSGPLAFDASDIYWVTATSDGKGDGAALKIRRDDGSSVTLTTGFDSAGNNAGVNSHGLFWPGATPDDPVSGNRRVGIFAVALGGGGAPALWPSSDGCMEWAFVDATNLYCTSIKIPLDGSSPTPLATPALDSVGAAIFGAAIDTRNLYLVTYGCHLLKVPLDGEPAVTLATLPTPHSFDPGYGCGGPLVVDTHNAYVASTFADTVLKIALDGSGAVTTLATFDSPAYNGIAIDATSVYFAATTDGESQIVRVTPK